MFFTAITKAAPTYGQGRPLGSDRFEQFGGVQMFFYDPNTIQQEFGPFGLTTIDEVPDNYPLYFITCRKPAAAPE